MRTIADTTEHGKKDTSWNQRGCTSCPGLRQAQIHSTNPARAAGASVGRRGRFYAMQTPRAGNLVRFRRWQK